MSSQPEGRSSMTFGPWKLFRVVFRVILFSTLAWIVLALLWGFLPSPSAERDGDSGADYATSVLRSGKILTRVYNSETFHINDLRRQGFALDFKLDVENLNLSIISSGIEEAIAIVNDEGANDPDAIGRIDAVARIGDTDGANLPWFPFADSVLLYWQIQKDILAVPLTVRWSRSDGDLRTMTIGIVGARSYDLLTVEMQGNDKSTLTAIAPPKPSSSSPTKTYPIRVAIIYVLAPTAIFINDLLGNALGAAISTMVDLLFVSFIVFVYAFFGIAVVVSILRVLGRGPSFETAYESMQGRLDKLAEVERLQFLRINVLNEKLDHLYHSKRLIKAVNICRNGWHPERDAAERAAEEDNDVEKAKPSI